MAKVVKAALSPRREVPPHIIRPQYAMGKHVPHVPANYCMTPMEIECMRAACRVARKVLEITKSAVAVGVTTDRLDEIAHEACVAAGAYPSPLGYAGFPKSICTSVNEVICHGIPDSRPLADGDIVNIDVTVYLNGMHGDLSETVLVGSVSPEKRRLVEVTYEAMMRGIKAVVPGETIGDIGKAIEPFVKKYGFSVVRAYCGHGIGTVFHTGLIVPHHIDKKAKTRIRSGMVFTIEPMINMGTWEHKVWPDRWTAVTADGKPSAQFEHTVLVTETGAEILTAPIDENL